VQRHFWEIHLGGTLGDVPTSRRRLLPSRPFLLSLTLLSLAPPELAHGVERVVKEEVAAGLRLATARAKEPFRFEVLSQKWVKDWIVALTGVGLCSIANSRPFLLLLPWSSKVS
jgi:hypothetical protein